MPIFCQSCGSDVSPTWWKCCPKHTTEQGIDVVCQSCANICLNGQKEPKTLICTVCGLVENVKRGSPERIKETVFGIVCNSCVQSFEEWLAKKDVGVYNER